MSGPFAPDTLSVVNTLKTMLTDLKLSDGITSAYQTVKIGGIKDYTVLPLPCASIVLHDDESARWKHGGTIREPQEVEIRSVVDYTNEEAAELQIIGIRDVLMPLLNKYAVLPNTTTVYHSQIKAGPGGFKWLWLKPNWYRAHMVSLEVVQYYAIQGGIQNG